MKAKHRDALAALLSRLRDEEYCYLTTTGRVSGRSHEIEIWFAIEGRVLFMLSGGSNRSDWVRNLRANAAATVRIGEHLFTGSARMVDDEEEEKLARRLLAAKYQGWRQGRPLSEWARTALPVAIDVHHLDLKGNE